MPQPLSPRSLRGDAQFDLDAQYEDFVLIVDSIYEFDKVWTAFRAHLLRRAASANRKRNSALTSLSAAEVVDRRWDGVERRAVAA